MKLTKDEIAMVLVISLASASVGIAISLLLSYYAPQDKPTTIIEPVPIQEHTEEQKEPVRQFLGTYTIYAYCPCVKCCGKTNGITASGTVATEGRTVAANLPFGTRLYIDSIGERIVEDRGGGIGNGKIDLFVSSHEKALRFGVKRLDVWELRE